MLWTIRPFADRNLRLFGVKRSLKEIGNILSHAWFKRTKGNDSSDNERGEWLQKPSMPGSMVCRVQIQANAFENFVWG